MTIEWNRVTWYSKALAVLVFVGTFALAFWLGVTWERAQIEASLVESRGASSDADDSQAGGIAGAHCGGFIRNAPTCGAGFRCQLDVSSPDTGGTCVPEQETVSAPSWAKGMTIIAQNANGTTVQLQKNERFAIELGDQLDWTVSFEPKGAISRVANSIDTGGFQGVYAADKAGTATMTAVGKPRCAAGMMCAQYLVEITVTLLVAP